MRFLFFRLTDSSPTYPEIPSGTSELHQDILPSQPPDRDIRQQCDQHEDPEGKQKVGPAPDPRFRPIGGIRVLRLLWFFDPPGKELAEHAAKKKSLYTESTFWFDIHYVLFGLLVIGVILLIANAVWKRKLMKEEQTLIAKGEEAAA